MSYGIPLLGSLVISFLLTGVLKRVGFKYGWVSKPRPRDIHKKPIPRIGGSAIFLAFILISGIYFLAVKPDLASEFGSGEWWGVNKHILGIWLASILVVLGMFFDDIFGLPAWEKLLIQISAGLIIIGSGIGVSTLTNPFGGEFNLDLYKIPVSLGGITFHYSLIADTLTLAWLVGMMNIMNFVDGVDGLAGGLSVIAAGTLFMLSYSIPSGQSATALLSIILAGSAAGFLIWNFPPAKIFMGDAGSMFLGLILGVIPLITGGKLATIFLVLGFPIVDGMLVAGGRILRKQNPFTTPDKTHLHHRFLAAGLNAKQSILFLYAISVAFAWVALRSTTSKKFLAAIFLVFLLVVLINILKVRAKKVS